MSTLGMLAMSASLWRRGHRLRSVDGVLGKLLMVAEPGTESASTPATASAGVRSHTLALQRWPMSQLALDVQVR